MHPSLLRSLGCYNMVIYVLLYINHCVDKLRCLSLLCVLAKAVFIYPLCVLGMAVCTCCVCWLWLSVPTVYAGCRCMYPLYVLAMTVCTHCVYWLWMCVPTSHCVLAAGACIHCVWSASAMYTHCVFCL